MLQAQVNYWDFMERQRHNLATESQAQAELEESRRHNVKNESLAFMSAVETGRHNKATEAQQLKDLELGYTNAFETIRSHKASESINWANARTNRLQAQIASTKVYYDNINTQFGNRTNRMNAYTNRANANARKGELILKQAEYNLNAKKVPAELIIKGTSTALKALKGVK